MAKKTTLLGISTAAGVACAALGCHPALDLQAISASFIDCNPSQVVVGNDEAHSGLREWDALYQDEEWHCVRQAWARTATAWVGTECRRVYPPGYPAAPHRTTKQVSSSAVGQEALSTLK